MTVIIIILIIVEIFLKLTKYKTKIALKQMFLWCHRWDAHFVLVKNYLRIFK